MPEVSIVIAAYRPQYLDLAIASALAQTFRDFELLISDDSDGDAVEAVVEKWPDPRIRYTRNPRRQQPGANRDYLIQLASGRYVKFLWDDDYLLPQSLEVLVAAAKAHRAKLAFHHRYFVDDEGLPQPSFAPIPEGAVMGVPPKMIFDLLVTGNRTLRNSLGEPSSILVETACLRSLGTAFALGGRRVRFLDDIALFTNMAHGGHPVVGIGVALSAFRCHSEQMSNGRNAVFSSGLYEWELVTRWSADTGHLAAGDCVAKLEMLRNRYFERLADFPELAPFVALGAQPDGDGRFLTPEFDAAFTSANEAIDARRRARLEASSARARRHAGTSVRAASPRSEGRGGIGRPSPADRPDASVRPRLPSGTASAPQTSAVARPTSPSRVTFAVPVQDQAVELARCLVALSGSLPPSLDFEVIVIDNGSTDAIDDVLASVRGDIRAVRRPRSVSGAGALDQAFGESDGSYFCLVDVDFPPPGQWVEPLVDALDGVQALAAVLATGPDGDAPDLGRILVRASALQSIGGFAACDEPSVEGVMRALKRADLQVAAVQVVPSEPRDVQRDDMDAAASVARIGLRAGTGPGGAATAPLTPPVRPGALDELRSVRRARGA